MTNTKEEILFITLFISCFISHAESAGMWERISTGITDFVTGTKTRRDASPPYSNGPNYNYNRFSRNDYYGGGGGGTAEYYGDRYGLEYGNQYSPAMSSLSLLGFLFFLNLISQTMMQPALLTGRKKRELLKGQFDSPDEVNACIERFLCEVNQRDLNTEIDLNVVLTRAASIAFSYAIHSQNTTQLSSDMNATKWGIEGNDCEDLATNCPYFPL